jgi:hypothetical protein
MIITTENLSDLLNNVNQELKDKKQIYQYFNERRRQGKEVCYDTWRRWTLNSKAVLFHKLLQILEDHNYEVVIKKKGE